MTIPIERTLAVMRTRDFLMDLVKDQTTPEHIRQKAGRLLRHYPSVFELERVSEKAPDIFDNPTPHMEKGK